MESAPESGGGSVAGGSGAGVPRMEHASDRGEPGDDHARVKFDRLMLHCEPIMTSTGSRGHRAEEPPYSPQYGGLCGPNESPWGTPMHSQMASFQSRMASAEAEGVPATAREGSMRISTKGSTNSGQRIWSYVSHQLSALSRSSFRIKPAASPIHNCLVGDVSIRGEILRGVQISKAVGRFGALWRTAPDDLPLDQRSALWNLSAPCNEVDAFISHAWSSPWWQRYITLMVHFYWRPAAIAACSSLLALTLLDLFHFLPHALIKPELAWSHFVNLSPWFPIPPLLGLLVLFLGPMLFRSIRSNIFLDVVCINQTDEKLKTEGVLSIAGFLNRSNKMIVLWTPHNLGRLWCIFELATFIALKGDDHVVWCPIFCYNCFFFVYVVITVDLIAMIPVSFWVLGSDIPMVVQGALVMAQHMPLITVIHIGRGFMREKRQMVDELAQFDIANGKCRKAEDRIFVLNSVKHWYGSIRAFNEYVRGPLAHRITTSMTGSEATYLNMFSASFSVMCFVMAILVSYGRQHWSFNEHLAHILNMLNLGLLVAPSWLKAFWILTEVFQHRCRNRVADFIMSVLLTIMWEMMGHALLLALAQHSLIGAVVCLAVCAVSTAALFYLSPRVSMCLQRDTFSRRKNGRVHAGDVVEGSMDSVMSVMSSGPTMSGDHATLSAEHVDEAHLQVPVSPAQPGPPSEVPQRLVEVAAEMSRKLSERSKEFLS